MKKLKWGSVYLFITNSLYFVVHLDGYVQRILKNKRLSTKLSTFWQIIDYLSKKINYRSGHPAVDELMGNQLYLGIKHALWWITSGDRDDECDECSLEIWADAEKFSNGKKNLPCFPSRHFRGSFAYLSQFWFVTMLFLGRRFLQQKLSKKTLPWEPVRWPDIQFPQWDRCLEYNVD